MAAPLHIIVTGAAGGIGQHLADRLAAAGHRLLLADVNFVGLSEHAAARGWQPPRVRIASLDVREPDQWEKTVEAAWRDWPRIDVLLNVAGVIKPGFAHEMSPDDVSFHLDINTKGVIYGTQTVARAMIQQGFGQIINVASLAGIAAVPGLSLYTASKFAVRGFTLAVAHELRPHGISVSVVCPDAVQTPMLDKQLDYDEAALTFSGSQPLTVEQVGRAVIDRALGRKHLEVVIPRSRGWLAKLASLMPGLSGRLLPALKRKGESRQAEARRQRDQSRDDATKA